MITQRIKQYIDYKEYTVSSFESSIGASNGMLRKAFNAKTDIKSQWLENILEKYHDINSEWLLTGSGEMIKNVSLKGKEKGKVFDDKPKMQKNSSMEMPQTYVNTRKTTKKNDEVLDIVKETAEIHYTSARKINAKDKLVPYYDVDFAAGNSIIMTDDNTVHPTYYMDVPEFSGCTAFRAYSDSMEKLIKSGSILFGTKIDSWLEHLEYGQIYGVICNDGRRYLKYIRKAIKYEEYFLLRSENADYDDFDIPKKAIRSIWLIHGWLNKRT